MQMSQSEDLPKPGKRRVRKDALAAMLIVAAFDGVLVAILAGVAPGRLWPVVWFLAIGAAAAVYVVIANRLIRRRASKLRSAEVRWGIRLRKPIWMSLGDTCTMVALGAALAAVVAGLGFPGVAMGILLTIVAVGVCLPFLAELGLAARALTFEPDGLRVHIRAASFLVKWKAIANVERWGPDSYQALCLRISDVAGVVGTAQPDEPRVRARIDTLVREGNGPDGKLLLMPWMAGLDGVTLARTISAGMSGNGPVDRAN
jgi:hypothetical protein